VAKKRVISAIADIQKHDDADRFRETGVDVYHGYGHFKDVHHVQIDSGKESKGTEEVIRLEENESLLLRVPVQIFHPLWGSRRLLI
jgi:pyruvate/2-oxoglutarate dehydrogenase complex dihydrolipoamide dehydrogenase (E3) component